MLRFHNYDDNFIFYINNNSPATRVLHTIQCSIAFTTIAKYNFI